jgi:hypothetical protein
MTSTDRPDGPRSHDGAADRAGQAGVGPVAPRRTRTVLAYAYVAAVALAAAAALGLRGTASAAAQLAALVAMAGLWVALRRATRLAADAPAQDLDAFVVRLRDRAYVLAYQMLAVVTLGGAVVLLLFSRGGIGEPVATALAWAGLGSALGLPLVVTAVALPEGTAAGAGPAPRP